MDRFVAILMYIKSKDQHLLPEASFGLRVLSLPASVGVRVCVRQPLACPRDIASPVQVRITKDGPEVKNKKLG